MAINACPQTSSCCCLLQGEIFTSSWGSLPLIKGLEETDWGFCMGGFDKGAVPEPPLPQGVAFIGRLLLAVVRQGREA